MSDSLTAPIWIPCEGSGCRTVGGGLCSMCGEYVLPYASLSDIASAHDRKDILAMIDRGDFETAP